MGMDGWAWKAHGPNGAEEGVTLADRVAGVSGSSAETSPVVVGAAQSAKTLNDLQAMLDSRPMAFTGLQIISCSIYVTGTLRDDDRERAQAASDASSDAIRWVSEDSGRGWPKDSTQPLHAVRSDNSQPAAALFLPGESVAVADDVVLVHAAHLRDIPLPAAALLAADCTFIGDVGANKTAVDLRLASLLAGATPHEHRSREAARVASRAGTILHQPAQLSGAFLPVLMPHTAIDLGDEAMLVQPSVSNDTRSQALPEASGVAAALRPLITTPVAAVHLPMWSSGCSISDWVDSPEASVSGTLALFPPAAHWAGDATGTPLITGMRSIISSSPPLDERVTAACRLAERPEGMPAKLQGLLAPAGVASSDSLAAGTTPCNDTLNSTVWISAEHDVVAAAVPSQDRFAGGFMKFSLTDFHLFDPSGTVGNFEAAAAGIECVFDGTMRLPRLSSAPAPVLLLQRRAASLLWSQSAPPVSAFVAGPPGSDRNPRGMLEPMAPALAVAVFETLPGAKRLPEQVAVQHTCQLSEEARQAGSTTDFEDAGSWAGPMGRACAAGVSHRRTQGHAQPHVLDPLVRCGSIRASDAATFTVLGEPAATTTTGKASSGASWTSLVVVTPISAANGTSHHTGWLETSCVSPTAPRSFFLTSPAPVQPRFAVVWLAQPQPLATAGRPMATWRLAAVPASPDDAAAMRESPGSIRCGARVFLRNATSTESEKLAALESGSAAEGDTPTPPSLQFRTVSDAAMFGTWQDVPAVWDEVIGAAVADLTAVAVALRGPAMHDAVAAVLGRCSMTSAGGDAASALLVAPGVLAPRMTLDAVHEAARKLTEARRSNAQEPRPTAWPSKSFRSGLVSPAAVVSAGMLEANLYGASGADLSSLRRLSGAAADVPLVLLVREQLEFVAQPDASLPMYASTLAPESPWLRPAPRVRIVIDGPSRAQCVPAVERGQLLPARGASPNTNRSGDNPFASSDGWCRLTSTDNASAVVLGDVRARLEDGEATWPSVGLLPIRPAPAVALTAVCAVERYPGAPASSLPELPSLAELGASARARSGRPQRWSVMRAQLVVRTQPLQIGLDTMSQVPPDLTGAVGMLQSAARMPAGLLTLGYTTACLDYTTASAAASRSEASLADASLGPDAALYARLRADAPAACQQLGRMPVLATAPGRASVLRLRVMAADGTQVRSNVACALRAVPHSLVPWSEWVLSNTSFPGRPDASRRQPPGSQQEMSVEFDLGPLQEVPMVFRTEPSLEPARSSAAELQRVSGPSGARRTDPAAACDGVQVLPGRSGLPVGWTWTSTGQANGEAVSRTTAPDCPPPGAGTPFFASSTPGEAIIRHTAHVEPWQSLPVVSVCRVGLGERDVSRPDAPALTPVEIIGKPFVLLGVPLRVAAATEANPILGNEESERAAAIHPVAAIADVLAETLGKAPLASRLRDLPAASQEALASAGSGASLTGTTSSVPGIPYAASASGSLARAGSVLRSVSGAMPGIRPRMAATAAACLIADGSETGSSPAVPAARVDGTAQPALLGSVVVDRTTQRPLVEPLLGSGTLRLPAAVPASLANDFRSTVAQSQAATAALADGKASPPVASRLRQSVRAMVLLDPASLPVGHNLTHLQSQEAISVMWAALVTSLASQAAAISALEAAAQPIPAGVWSTTTMASALGSSRCYSGVAWAPGQLEDPGADTADMTGRTIVPPLVRFAHLVLSLPPGSTVLAEMDHTAPGRAGSSPAAEGGVLGDGRQAVVGGSNDAVPSDPTYSDPTGRGVIRVAAAVMMATSDAEVANDPDAKGVLVHSGSGERSRINIAFLSEPEQELLVRTRASFRREAELASASEASEDGVSAAFAARLERLHVHASPGSVAGMKLRLGGTGHWIEGSFSTAVQAPQERLGSSPIRGAGLEVSPQGWTIVSQEHSRAGWGRKSNGIDMIVPIAAAMVSWGRRPESLIMPGASLGMSLVRQSRTDNFADSPGTLYVLAVSMPRTLEGRLRTSLAMVDNATARLAVSRRFADHDWKPTQTAAAAWAAGEAHKAGSADSHDAAIAATTVETGQAAPPGMEPILCHLSLLDPLTVSAGTRVIGPLERLMQVGARQRRQGSSAGSVGWGNGTRTSLLVAAAAQIWGVGIPDADGLADLGDSPVLMAASQVNSWEAVWSRPRDLVAAVSMAESLATATVTGELASVANALGLQLSQSQAEGLVAAAASDTSAASSSSGGSLAVTEQRLRAVTEGRAGALMLAALRIIAPQVEAVSARGWLSDADETSLPPAPARILGGLGTVRATMSGLPNETYRVQLLCSADGMLVVPGLLQSAVAVEGCPVATAPSNGGSPFSKDGASGSQAARTTAGPSEPAPATCARCGPGFFGLGGAAPCEECPAAGFDCSSGALCGMDGYWPVPSWWPVPLFAVNGINFTQRALDRKAAKAAEIEANTAMGPGSVGVGATDDDGFDLDQASFGDGLLPENDSDLAERLPFWLQFPAVFSFGDDIGPSTVALPCRAAGMCFAEPGIHSMRCAPGHRGHRCEVCDTRAGVAKIAGPACDACPPVPWSAGVLMAWAVVSSAGLVLVSCFFRRGPQRESFLPWLRTGLIHAQSAGTIMTLGFSRPRLLRFATSPLQAMAVSPLGTPEASCVAALSMTSKLLFVGFVPALVVVSAVAAARCLGGLGRSVKPRSEVGTTESSASGTQGTSGRMPGRDGSETESGTSIMASCSGAISAMSIAMLVVLPWSIWGLAQAINCSAPVGGVSYHRLDPTVQCGTTLFGFASVVAVTSGLLSLLCPCFSARKIGQGSRRRGGLSDPGVRSRYWCQYAGLVVPHRAIIWPADASRIRRILSAESGRVGLPDARFLVGILVKSGSGALHSAPAVFTYEEKDSGKRLRPTVRGVPATASKESVLGSLQCDEAGEAAAKDAAETFSAVNPLFSRQQTKRRLKLAHGGRDATARLTGKLKSGTAQADVRGALSLLRSGRRAIDVRKLDADAAFSDATRKGSDTDPQVGAFGCIGLFRRARHQWFMVLLLRLTALQAISLVDDPRIQLLLATVVLAVAMASHMLARPMASNEVQATETLSLSCLLTVTAGLFVWQVLQPGAGAFGPWLDVGQDPARLKPLFSNLTGGEVPTLAGSAACPTTPSAALTEEAAAKLFADFNTLDPPVSLLAALALYLPVVVACVAGRRAGRVRYALHGEQVAGGFRPCAHCRHLGRRSSLAVPVVAPSGNRPTTGHPLDKLPQSHGPVLTGRNSCCAVAGVGLVVAMVDFVRLAARAASCILCCGSRQHCVSDLQGVVRKCCMALRSVGRRGQEARDLEAAARRQAKAEASALKTSSSGSMRAGLHRMTSAPSSAAPWPGDGDTTLEYENPLHDTGAGRRPPRAATSVDRGMPHDSSPGQGAPASSAAQTGHGMSRRSALPRHAWSARVRNRLRTRQLPLWCAFTIEVLRGSCCWPCLLANTCKPGSLTLPDPRMRVAKVGRALKGVGRSGHQQSLTGSPSRSGDDDGSMASETSEDESVAQHRATAVLNDVEIPIEPVIADCCRGLASCSSGYAAMLWVMRVVQILRTASTQLAVDPEGDLSSDDDTGAKRRNGRSIARTPPAADFWAARPDTSAEPTNVVDPAGPPRSGSRRATGLGKSLHDESALFGSFRPAPTTNRLVGTMIWRTKSTNRQDRSEGVRPFATRGPGLAGLASRPRPARRAETGRHWASARPTQATALPDTSESSEVDLVRSIASATDLLSSPGKASRMVSGRQRLPPEQAPGGAVSGSPSRRSRGSLPLEGLRPTLPAVGSSLITSRVAAGALGQGPTIPRPALRPGRAPGKQPPGPSSPAPETAALRTFGPLAVAGGFATSRRQLLSPTVRARPRSTAD